MEELTVEQRDEYNQKYQQAYEILREHIFIHDRPPVTVGFFGRRTLKKAFRGSSPVCAIMIPRFGVMICKSGNYTY
jgi:hypothetical protein